MRGERHDISPASSRERRWESPSPPPEGTRYGKPVASKHGKRFDSSSKPRVR